LKGVEVWDELEWIDGDESTAGVGLPKHNTDRNMCQEKHGENSDALDIFHRFSRSIELQHTGRFAV